MHRRPLLRVAAVSLASAATAVLLATGASAGGKPGNGPVFGPYLPDTSAASMHAPVNTDGLGRKFG